MGDVSGLLDFSDVVDELQLSFRSREDWPKGHRCVKPLGYPSAMGYDPPNVCTHHQVVPRPLLDRLQELVAPGSSGPRSEDSDRQPSKRAGSPAPWAAKPAELLDEVLLGALAFNSSIRARLGMPELEVTRRVLRPDPDWRPPMAWPPRPRRVRVTQVASVVPKQEAGRAALADLPRVLAKLQLEDPDDPDANGPYVKPSEPWRGRRWGNVEATVRYWHKQARLITGHISTSRTVVHRLPNPHAGAFWPGPLHESPNDCGDPSCWVLQLSRDKEHLTLRCPHCRTIGLVQDEITGALFCDRPSCRDESGNRHEWSIVAIFELLNIEGGELLR